MRTRAAHILIALLLLTVSLSAKTGMKAAASMNFQVENSDSMDNTAPTPDSLAKTTADTANVVEDDIPAPTQPPASVSPESPDLPIPDSFVPYPDTSAIDATGQSKAEVKEKNPDLRDPGLAALLSGVIPGGGQTYNGKYIKAGFFLAAEAAVMYYALDNNTKAQDLWDSRVDMEPDTPEWTQAGRDYDRYVDDRNLLLWVFTGLHIVNVLDAFVDAHLSGFPAEMEQELGPIKDASAASESCSLAPRIGIRNNKPFLGLELSF